MEAIKARRSIRKYKPDPVPEQALHTVPGGCAVDTFMGQHTVLGNHHVTDPKSNPSWQQPADGQPGHSS